jgi:hypothetical protein
VEYETEKKKYQVALFEDQPKVENYGGSGILAEYNLIQNKGEKFADPESFGLVWIAETTPDLPTPWEDTLTYFVEKGWVTVSSVIGTSTSGL